MLQSNAIIKRENSHQIGRVGGFFHFDNEPSIIYGISNNHVIANLNQCRKGDVICDEKNTPIGTLSDWIKLSQGSNSNNSEFALFKLKTDLIPSWNLWGEFAGKKPFGFKPPVDNMNVVFPINGSLSDGIIQNSHISVQINWFGEDFLFTNCIKIIAQNGRKFSDHGDSGGAIFSYDNYLIGLILGIKEDQSATYAIPFYDSILNYCDLKIYGK